MEVKRVGNIYGFTGGSYAGAVYDPEGIAPSIDTMSGGNRQPMIVAMRGRNPDNPSDRKGGVPLEQRLEPHQGGICGSLTTMYKDNMVLETVKIKQATKQGYAECRLGGVADLSYPDSTSRRGRVQGGGDISPALIVTDLAGIKRIESLYRIRKLTPLECWRLMGFTDEEFKAAEAVNSNTQLYKQAGNSIVVDVLVGIFRNIIKSLEVKDMANIEEKQFQMNSIVTDKMIDLVKFREKEPELFEELVADYPAEGTNFFIAVMPEKFVG